MAVDLSHHLSREGRERLPNPMKAISSRVADAGPGMLSLANGEPHPKLFSVTGIDVHVPSPRKILFPEQAPGTTEDQILKILTGGSSDETRSAVDLAVALQYSSGRGLRTAITLLQQLNEMLHKPPHNNVILTCGNVDAASKIFRMVCERGDTMLVEEFSFPGTTNAPLAMGVRWAPLRIDAKGIIPEEVERVMSTWDEAKQGRRPRLLYTIPAGQNPTGSTLSVERRRRIYELAQKYDLLILEDDPYYFLQYYDAPPDSDSPEDFLKQLAPTFLSMDVDGRVLRVDTLSKTLVPGLRLGWVTCNELFAEKLHQMVDSTTQAPSGISQAFLCELLHPNRGWGIPGYLTWCRNLRDEYQRRRNLFHAALTKHVLSSGYASTYVPEAGMFFWVEIAIDKHPRWTDPTLPEDEDARTMVLMQELQDEVFEKGLAVMPAAPFAIQPSAQVHDESKITADMHPKRLNNLRLTFVPEDATVERAMELLGRALIEFFAC